ncbi:alpha/beta hydrolase, partial [bacterium SCGC AG-212-C10]
TFGRREDPPLLLVMGLGAQMIQWDEEFCRQLADRGFHVIRYDNRDTGLSSKIEGGPLPDIAAAMAGDFSSASYTLSDMAADGMALLTALGIDKAHIVGASMGGMIVQQMVIDHPQRIRTMTSIMSTTGNPEVGQATEEARAALLSPQATSREEAIERGVKSGRVMSGGGFPFDEDAVRERAARVYDRAFYPMGFARQILAIRASGDRTEALRSVRLPVLVIHGAADPLITLSGGEATAAAIPDAELLVIPGMGHEQPAGAWPPILDGIVRTAQRELAVAR